MTEERIKLLDKVGFEWGCQSWEKSYEELVTFVKD
eukprot:CAMPEP_0194432138 /NCGR_PEP_ID=MMETSP0176-20130528/68556_1 /TAXON_ID=216777 /ORGANISM="Proboscia alata, Strain PI-D3" /LENGTH=34 /DNA_ID= /DNA_START= /DNA_END= /DNA_ORIENTATION=